MRLDTSYPSLATSRSFLLETANAIIQGFNISTPESIISYHAPILSYASIERVYAYEGTRPNSRKLVQEGDEGSIGNSIETNTRPS